MVLPNGLEPITVTLPQGGIQPLQGGCGLGKGSVIVPHRWLQVLPVLIGVFVLSVVLSALRPVLVRMFMSTATSAGPHS